MAKLERKRVKAMKAAKKKAATQEALPLEGQMNAQQDLPHDLNTVDPDGVRGSVNCHMAPWLL